MGRAIFSPSVIARKLLSIFCLLCGISLAGQNTPARFLPPVTIPVAAKFVATGDFNGDGKVDIAAVGTDTLFIILGNGDGTFQSPLEFPLNIGDSWPLAIAVGDFNGDSKLDVVVSTADFGTNR